MSQSEGDAKGLFKQNIFLWLSFLFLKQNHSPTPCRSLQSSELTAVGGGGERESYIFDLFGFFTSQRKMNSYSKLFYAKTAMTHHLHQCWQLEIWCRHNLHMTRRICSHLFYSSINSQACQYLCLICPQTHTDHSKDNYLYCFPPSN